MSILGKIFGTGAKEIAETVTDIVGEFHTSETERAEIQRRTYEAVSARLAAIEESVRARFEMVARVIETETKNGNTYTKNARPTIVYAGLVIHVANALGPMFGVGQQIEVDPNFTYVWGGVCGVWIVGRSAEKMGAMNRAASKITGNPPDDVFRMQL